jgi:proline dehydrogenase
MALRLFFSSNSRFLRRRMTTTWPISATRFRSSHATTQQQISTYPLRRRSFVVASGLVFVGSIALFASSRSRTHAEERSTVHHDNHVQRATRSIPLSSLIRSYLVYSMCSVPILIDWSPSVLSVLSSIPGVKQVTELFVRHTFFSQVRSCMASMT